MTRPPALDPDVDHTVAPHPRGADGFVATMYDDHHAEVYAFLARSTRDPATAEDLLQETFLRLTTEVRAGRTPELVRAWLFRVASNLAISRARRVVTANAWLDRHGQREDLVAESPESGVLRRERSSTIERSLGRLAPDARVAMLLSAHGFHGEEIAASIGRSHAATRSMLFRARAQLRDELLAEDVR